MIYLAAIGEKLIFVSPNLWGDITIVFSHLILWGYLLLGYKLFVQFIRQVGTIIVKYLS